MYDSPFVNYSCVFTSHRSKPVNIVISVKCTTLTTNEKYVLKHRLEKQVANNTTYGILVEQRSFVALWFTNYILINTQWDSIRPQIIRPFSPQ